MVGGVLLVVTCDSFREETFGDETYGAVKYGYVSSLYSSAHHFSDPPCVFIEEINLVLAKIEWDS
jgi:hypothetical protein